MAIAVQANLVQFRTAAVRRWPGQQALERIEIPPPGHVAAYRETLFDRETLKGMPDEVLSLGLREVWGQHCAMRWIFQQSHDGGTADFAKLGAEAEMHCETSLAAKLAEVHALVWRALHELRLRNDPAYREGPAAGERAAMAAQIPDEAYRTAPGAASEEELVQLMCEFVGMLRVLRWVTSPATAWGDPALGVVGDQPF